MPGTSARSTLPAEFVEKSAAKERAYCRKCGDRVFRIYRKGFMQEKIYPYFGYFPWRCINCHNHVMLHKR